MTPAHAARALVAVSGRETFKFARQRGRLFSALVRPTLWLVVFAVGFQNVFGVSIIPPSETYIEYQEYIVPGLVGMVLLFNGMQSSLAMVYDREMEMRSWSPESATCKNWPRFHGARGAVFVPKLFLPSPLPFSASVIRTCWAVAPVVESGAMATVVLSVPVTESNTGIPAAAPGACWAAASPWSMRKCRTAFRAERTSRHAPVPSAGFSVIVIRPGVVGSDVGASAPVVMSMEASPGVEVPTLCATSMDTRSDRGW